MSQLKIGVIGASGKMGLNLLEVIHEKKMTPFLGIDRIKKSSGFMHSDDNVDSEMAKEVDLWIDFSLPESFEKILLNLKKYKRPIVSGTTGLKKNHFEILGTISQQCPVLWASNMSLGIAVLQSAMEAFSKISNFDFQIEEFHHNKKRDAPSGTAITLQNKLEAVIGRSAPSPVSIRGGGIFGVHKVWAMSDQEVLMFEHQALNRKVFAEGAVYAGLRLMKMKSGLYELKDIL